MEQDQYLEAGTGGGTIEAWSVGGLFDAEFP